MFKTKNGGPAASGGLNSVLGEGSQLAGTLRVEGSIRVDGDLEGSLTASDAVIIGRAGRVRADLRAREILVAGHVEGKLIAQERVELQAGARVEGDIWTQSLAIAEGVLFLGNSSMGEDAQALWQSPREAPVLPGPAEREGTGLAVFDSGARRYR
jgi:cytoskeletal protein CcmA (bactofilin family)